MQLIGPLVLPLLSPLPLASCWGQMSDAESDLTMEQGAWCDVTVFRDEDIKFFKVMIQEKPEQLWQAIPLGCVSSDGNVNMGRLKYVLPFPWSEPGLQFKVYGEDRRKDWVLVNPVSFPHLLAEDGAVRLKLQVCPMVVRACPWSGQHSIQDKKRIQQLSMQSPLAMSGYELLWAADNGCLTCTKQLVEWGVDINFKSVTCGWTPLAFATEGKKKAQSEEQRQRCQAVIDFLHTSGGTF